MKLSTPVYTLVQHSGSQKPGFVHAVEEAAVTTEGERKKVVAAGGLLFDSYTQASDAAFAENYPPDLKGMYPRVQGSFSKSVIGYRQIYVPKVVQQW